MECKYVQDKLIALHHLELIDTLWNVNIAKFVMIVTPVAELIDTLWNVNYLPSVSNFEPIARINRYIMECKCVSRSTLLSVRLLELIDTLWNVNVPALPQPLRCAEELIDTLWNVNKAAQWCNENGTWN